jgi:uncharacterized protein (TIGR02118 family)
MIQLFAFLRRRPGMSREDFDAHWREVHARLLAGTPELAAPLLRYEQNPALGPQGRFDGVAVLWFGSPRGFRAFSEAPAYAELLGPDEARFLDRGGLTFLLAGPPRAVVPAGAARDGAPLRLLALLRRRAGLDPAAFQRHWSEVHGPLVRDALGDTVLGYEQSPGLARDGAPRADGWDGVASVWYPDLAAFEAAAGAAYAQHIAPDEERFLDRAATAFALTGPARVVIDRSGD